MATIWMLGAAALALCAHLKAGEIVVDLRTPPAAPAKAPGPPAVGPVEVRDGIEVYQIKTPAFGASGSAHAKQEPFPITVSIMRIWPLSPRSRESFEVDLRIRNTGSEPLTLPISAGLAPGENPRIALRLRLEAEVPGGAGSQPQEGFGLLPAMYGSASVPGSMVTLKPNDELLVRTTGEIRMASEVWLEREKRQTITATVKVVASLQTFPDQELKSSDESAQVVSINSIQLTLSR